MTMQNGNSAPVETVAGLIEATNPKGIRIGGHWFNWSNFGPALERPVGPS